MSKIGDYKNFNGLDKNYFVWFVIYISIGMILYFTLPFPISLLIYLGIILILQTFRIKKTQHSYQTNISDISEKNNKNKGFREFIQSISDTLFYNPYSPRSEPLRFVCMTCNNEHNKRRCPNCGSGAVKVK